MLLKRLGGRRRGYRRSGQRIRRAGKGLLRAAGYGARLVGEGLVQNAGIALVGAAALKLKGSRSATPVAPSFSSNEPLVRFKRGRPKGKKDSSKRSRKILTSKNKPFQIKDKDLDKSLSRVESASRSYSNVAKGSRNLVASRKEAALSYRYEQENSPLDRNIRRANKVVNTVDTARRGAQSIGLIRRSRTRGGSPVRRAAAGLRLLRRVTS